ncbi:serine hydrolase domain-containing protein [Zhouia amylolytica]|uniref:serine hydrolase domain-containing protein n=1 Tax=Zhouia amylolytica TaxID=376730 RepID=UPI0020CF0A9B|nr:serine hydrolase domain-containing protein [Zhouia amylolytica]MCQ0112538.1 beta-lactamase family protein [Zhouia amylolytica]
MYKSIIPVLFLLTNVSVKSQSIKDSITSELTALSKKSSVVGFGVAIVNSDSLVYSGGFGYADLKSQIAYTRYTEQPIASISKTLLAVALMKAQEIGKLNLNDPINNHLPFKIVNPNFPGDNITIQQLANHTSSILDGETYLNTYVFKKKIPPFYTHLADKDIKLEVEKWVELLNANEMMTFSEFIKKQYVRGQIWYDEKQNFSTNKPGSTYKYSNMGANIAAYIIEQVSGESYTSFIKKHILNPLEMNNSGWRGKSYESKNASTLYWYGHPIPEYDLITYPDGNFMTNVVDYGKFLNAMIRGYEGEDNLLTAESYKEMMKDPVSSDFRKGIFWSVDSEKIGHSGSDFGILTHAYFLREHNMGIIVFVNTSDTKNGTTEVRDIYRTLLKYVRLTP